MSYLIEAGDSGLSAREKINALIEASLYYRVPLSRTQDLNGIQNVSLVPVNNTADSWSFGLDTGLADWAFGPNITAIVDEQLVYMVVTDRVPNSYVQGNPISIEVVAFDQQGGPDSDMAQCYIDVNSTTIGPEGGFDWNDSLDGWSLPSNGAAIRKAITSASPTTYTFTYDDTYPHLANVRPGILMQTVIIFFAKHVSGNFVPSIGSVAFDFRGG